MIDTLLIVYVLLICACVVVVSLSLFRDTVHVAYAERDYAALFGVVLMASLIILFVFCVCVAAWLFCMMIGLV